MPWGALRCQQWKPSQPPTLSPLKWGHQFSQYPVNLSSQFAAGKVLSLSFMKHVLI